LGANLDYRFFFAVVGSNLLVVFFYWPEPVLEKLVRCLPEGLAMRACRQLLIVLVLMLTDVGVMMAAKGHSKKVTLWLLVLNGILAITSLPEQLIFDPIPLFSFVFH
jgi:hypothetical protein